MTHVEIAESYPTPTGPVEVHGAALCPEACDWSRVCQQADSVGACGPHPQPALQQSGEEDTEDVPGEHDGREEVHTWRTKHDGKGLRWSRAGQLPKVLAIRSARDLSRHCTCCWAAPQRRCPRCGSARRVDAKKQFWKKWIQQVFMGRMLSHTWTKEEHIVALGSVVLLAEAENDDHT
jgi:hypothetical protein